MQAVLSLHFVLQHVLRTICVYYSALHSKLQSYQHMRHTRSPNCTSIAYYCAEYTIAEHIAQGHQWQALAFTHKMVLSYRLLA